MNSFLKILSAVVSPLVGLVEGLISFALLVVFGVLKGINQFVTLLKRYGKPFGEKLFSGLGQIIHGFVSLAFGFHAYMNQPPKHFPAIFRPILSGLNLVLTPVYAVMRVLYRFLVRTFEIVRDDLAHLSAWISEQWQGLLTKAGIVSPLSGEQTVKVGERFTPKTIQEKYQTYLRGQSQELGREFQEFRQELGDVIAEARNSLAGKPKQDAIDQLSPFTQERNTIIISSVLINILALAFPLLMLQLYDRILSQRSIDTLVVFCVGVGLAVALESIIRIFRSYATAWISARFEHQAYVALSDRLLAEPINEFERKGTGTVLEEFKAISTLRYHYSGQTFQQLLDLPFTLLYVLIVFFISPWIGLLLLVGYSIFAFITWRNGRSFPAIVKEQKEMDLRRGNLLTEILKNVHTMKSMTMEALMLRRYERLQESCAKLMSKVTYALDMSSGVGSVFSPMMTVLVIALGAFLVITNQLSNGELAACILLGLRALAPLQRLGGMWSKHQQDQVLREKLNQLFKLPTLPVKQVQDDEASIQSDHVVASNLALAQITYQFPAVAEPIFNNISLEIAAGECVAIGGQSGSGRSTLLQLMAGILQPSYGEVLLDGANIKTLDLDLIASKVAYLPQRTIMFEGSLLDNITAFDSARIDRAMQIAKDLGLTDFVSRLPRGWDSVVGDMAADSMPPGFRQRVAIARALSSNPSVILFDDSSAAMDSEGDAMLLQFMASMRGKVTIVLVSARPSFLRLANRTLYLHQGKLYDNPMQAVTPLSTVIPKAEGGLSPALPAAFTPMAPAHFFENRELARVGEEKWHHVSETVNTNFKELSDFRSA